MARVDNYEQRFGGIGRLYGTEALARLRQAHICVIGIGGVGSWAVEALARSGVGKTFLCRKRINRLVIFALLCAASMNHRRIIACH